MRDKKFKAPTVFKWHGSWRTFFQVEGARYQVALGKIESVTRDQAQEAATAAKQRAISLAEREERRRVHNPLERYEISIRNRSDKHQENCARFEQRLTDKFGTDRNLLTLDQHDIEIWRDWLLHEVLRNDKGKGKRGLSPKTVKEHVDWLSAVFNWSDLPNPCRRVERPKRTEAERQEDLEFFTMDEMELMHRVCKNEVAHFWNGFLVLAHTGCRVAEVQGLRPEDLDRTLRGAWVTGKGGTRRQLILAGPMSVVWDALIDQMKTRPQANGYIFPQGETWFRKGMDRLSLKVFGENGKHGHPHMLRHTFATMALLHFRPAWEIAWLAKWMGHKNVNTTFAIYGHLIAAPPPSGYAFGARGEGRAETGGA